MLSRIIVLFNGHSAGLGLDDRGFEFRWGNFSLHQSVQTGSGIHPVSYPRGTRGSLPRSKAAGAWNWPLTSV